MIGHRIVSRHLLCAALLLAGLAAAASADAQPVAAASVAPTSTAFAGEPLTFPVTFDNTGTATGYGPFIDLVLPATGIDGAGTATDDGLTFVSATYLGQPVTAVVRTFNSSGQATHPYAVNNAGTALTVSGTAGDQLVVLLLPFGSFTAAQPAAVVQVTAALSNLADIGAPLAVRARGGFQFGADPLNNPPSDPSITGAFTANAMVTPVLWRLTTTYVGPENETATGPNFPRQYRIDVDVATGQTVTNLALSHQLPANLQFVSVVGTLINGAPAASVNVSTPSTSVPGGTLTRRLASVPGTSGTTDASLIFSAVVPRVDGNAVNVIVPATGDAASVVSDTSASGNWTPVDTRDTPTTVTSNVTATDHTLTARSLAVQKSVAIAIDTGAPGPTPGDTLEYTLALQLSDFFVARNLVFTDIVSDGQRRDPAFVPMLAISEHTGGSFPSSAMDAGNTTFVVDGVTGRTTATFRIGAEQLLRGLDDHLLGGCVPAGGTGVGAIDCTLFNGGATTVTVVYRTVVQETFDGAVPSGDASVDHGDVLSNQVTASASLLSTADALTPTGYTESDTSSATVTIVSGSLTKTIYAINGNTAISLPARLGPGDTVTYRLRYTLPSSDAEPLTITDYLPQPVLEAGQVSTTFSPVVSATPPPAGTARFGPDDTYMGISGLVPSITIDAPGNSVRFGYPAFDDTLNRSSSIDILFTVTATNAPYADGLFLVNHARVHEGSTNAGEAVADAVAQIILNEPNLRITKGVVASSNTARVFAPTTVGPVTFNAPGTLGNRFTGSITSNGLTSAPINSNVSVIDAGDVITFAIAVENIGQAPQGAFDITLNQALPAGFVIPGTGLNLRVANGAGLPMSFTDLGGGLFGTGIRLDDPSATQGALTTYGAVSGTNIAIITFDLQMASTIAANVLLTTTATLGHYAGAEGGPDFTTVDLIDSTTVRVAPPTLSKIITGTNQAHTTGTNVVIGEHVSYRLMIRIPEGTTPLATLTDTLDAGLAVVSLDSITASPALTRASGSFQDAFDAATIGAVGSGAANQGRLIALNFGTITNSDTNNAVHETIVLDYTVVVLNTPGNNRGVGINNAASLGYTGGPATTSATNAVVQEPDLRAVVTPVPTSGDADDPVTYTVTLSHLPASNAPAFEVTLADVMPAGVTYTGATFTGGTAPATFTPGNGFSATWVTFPLGATATFQVTGIVNGGLSSGSLLTNTATATFSSLPGSVTTPQTPHNTLSTERTGNPADPGGSTNDHIAIGNGSVMVSAAAVTKALVSTDQPHTTGNNVAIGEVLTYTVTVTVPEAVSNNVTLVDTLDPGLAFVGFDTLVVGNPAALSTSIAGGFPAVLTNAAVSNPTGSTETAGGRVLFNFGTITNTDVNNAAPETLTLTYRAVVLNTATNVRGTGRNNSVTWTAVTPPVNASAPNVIIIEPGLQAVKTVTPTRADAGDTVTYTIVVSHAAASNAPAFESALSDTLPAGLTVTAGPTATGTAPDTLTLSSGVINATWTTLPLGGSTTITFTARLDEALTPATVVTNVSNLSWTGLPGNAATSPSPHNALGVERTGNTAHPGAAANTYRASDPADVTINSNSLAGSVYVDVDGNGALTTGEPPIAGVSITLTGTDHLGNAVSQTTVTGADGGYAFLLLRPGTYTVREMQPAGYADGVDRAGTQLGTVGNDVISGVVLPTGGVTDAGGYDFGERPTADLEVLRTGAPGPALPGGTLPHTIVVRNHGPSNATQVVVRHPMPAGTAVTAIVAPGFSCTTPAPNTIGDVICTAAVLTAGASTTIDITTQVSPALLSGAVITYAASVSGEQVDLRPADNHYAAPITVASPGTADLSMTLTDDVDPVVAGGNVTYTLTIRNHGPAPASGVISTDTLPAGVTLVSATPSQGTACAGTTTVSCDLGTLTNGSTATVTVVVTPPAAGVLVNQADVTATETDPSLTNNQAAQSTTVGNAIDADLVVTQSDATDVVTPDDVIAYRVRVENRGPAPATSVVITDVLPAGTVFEGAIVPAGWTCTTPAIGAAGVVTCSVPSLPAGAAATLDLRVRVLPSTPPGTSAVNTATVTSPTPDPNSADNSSSETTLIAAAGAAEVAILITDAPDAQAAGAPLSYALTVTNNGPATATAVTITDPLPAGTSLMAGSTPCVASSGVVTCNLGTLLPGGTTVVGVTLATPPAATGLTNQASIAATQGDPVLSNNTDAESTTLVSVADVRIAVAGPPAATPGTVASYSFTVTNDGPSVAEAVTVSHTMPPGVTLVSVTGACTAFPCGLGTLPPSAVRTTTVTYQVPSGYIAPNPIQMSAAVSSTTNDNSTLNNQATVATPLSFGGDVEVLIAASTMSPGVGADFDYIITVRNLGPSDVTGTIISALLPAGTTYRAHAASVGTYVTGTSVWTIPALVAGGGSATLTLTVRADQAGPLAGTARRTGGAQPDPGSANDESTVTPVAVALADVSLIATGPAQVLAGSTIQYTLTVRNGGPGVATSVVVANPTPANLTFVSTTGACTTTFPCALGTLAPNEERVITVRFTVNLVPNGTLVQNTATVTASTPDNNTGNNASTANTTVDTRVDVAMTTSAVPSQARVGEPVTFTMTATNHGPNPASGLVATDALPAGLEFVSATPSAGSYDPLTGRWTIGTLPVGDTVTLTIVATVSLPGAITNSIVRTSQNEPDGDSSNDSASATINGGLYADIGVGTNAAPLDAVVGAPLTFTIIVRNYGRDLAPAVAVENLVPAAVQFVSASASAGTFDAVTGRWTVGSMTPGSAATLTVRTTVEQAGAFASTARVAGVGVFDPNPANDSDTVVLNAGTQVNLRVSKTAMRPMAGVFEEATFLVTIANDGPSPATGVEVADALPTGLTFVSAQASQGSYSPGTGIWSVGALAATQTATLHLTTRVMSTGPLVNRAQLAAVDQGDVNIDDNTATAVIVTPATTAGGCADIEMRQSFPSVAQPGGLVPGRYTAVNLGPSYAENLSFGGRIPSGVAVESMSASAGGVCTLVDGVVNCSWPGATLIGEGGARTADIVFRVIPSLAASTTVWGWFVTHNVSGDCYSANDIADHYVFIDGGGERADLQMRSALMMPHGAVSETAVQVGEPFHLRFAITNHGPDAGWGDWALKLSEPTAFIIDERVTNAGVLSASGPGHWDWLTGPIAPGTTVYADFRVRLMRSTAVRVNALRLRGGPVDPDASNDVSQLVVDGIGGATGGGRWVTTARLGGPGASIVTGTGEGDRPQVRVFTRSGADSPLRFYAFDPLFRGGVRVAACDIDGDGIDEIVAGQGPGGAAVRVMRIADNTAVEVAGVEPFESSFRGGVFVSCADVDADGRGDVIVGAGPGRAAEVRVFSVSSTGWTPRASWTAYDGFTGGVRVAGAAHPGSGIVGAFHVLTTPGSGRTVEARVWAVGGASASLVAAGGAFHAGYTGGATATVADIDHDGILDLAIAPDDPRAGLLRVFSLASGRWIIDVPAGTAGFTSSIRVAAAVLADGPGVTELVVASGPGTQPVVDVYRLVPGGAIRGARFLAIEVP